MSKRRRQSRQRPRSQASKILASPHELVGELLQAGVSPEEINRIMLPLLMGSDPAAGVLDPAVGVLDPAAGVLEPGGRGYEPQRPPTLLPSPSQPVIFRVRLDLDDVKPPIWRRLDLAGDLRLDEVHQVIIGAMGWSDSHLHAFQMGPRHLDRTRQAFVTEWEEQQGDGPPGGIPERTVRLDQVVAQTGDRLYHQYDFGDGWEHTIRVERVRRNASQGARAVCLAGSRAAPPEDCGGVPGYEDVLALLAGEPVHVHDPEELRQWLPAGYDPQHFDVDQANRVLSRVNGQSGESPVIGEGRGDFTSAALHPDLNALLSKLSLRPRTTLVGHLARLVPEDLSDAEVHYLTQWLAAFLTRVGVDGVDLTPAGYLKPAVVEALVEEFGLKGEVYGKGNREVNVLPVSRARSLAASAKLVRTAKGRLLLTVPGRKLLPGSGLWTDPRPLLVQVLAYLPIARDPAERDATMIWMVGVALGLDRSEREKLALEVLTAAGWQLDDGTPLSPAAVRWMLSSVRSTLLPLDPDLIGPHRREAGAPALRKALTLALLGQTDRIVSGG